MNQNRLIRSLCAALATTALAACANAADVKLEKKDNHVAITIDGKPFTDYYFAAEGDRPYVRPFFWPVRAADGTIVTSDQSQVKGGDHPHHRSLWVSHGDVNGANHWALTDKPIPRQLHLEFDKLEGDTIVEELDWESKGNADGTPGAPMLHEVRTIKVHGFDDGARAIDITVHLQAVIDSVTFGDTKEAGLCSVRFDKTLATNALITNSAGQTGEKDTWGKPADWCDMSLPIEGKEYGIAIFDHPGNPRHPTRWHVRQYGLMAANVFGISEFDKKEKGAGALTIKKGEPLEFSYRVLIHNGPAKDANLAQCYAEYAGGK